MLRITEYRRLLPLEDLSELGSSESARRLLVEDGRANGFVSQSRRTARLVQTANPVVAALRDFSLKHLPRSVLLRQLDASMRFELDWR